MEKSNFGGGDFGGVCIVYYSSPLNALLMHFGVARTGSIGRWLRTRFVRRAQGMKSVEGLDESSF